MNETIFTYDGDVYVRPVDRGICAVVDGELTLGPQLEEQIYAALGEGYSRVRITVERLEDV